MLHPETPLVRIRIVRTFLAAIASFAAIIPTAHPATDREWVDISSALTTRLTNNGARLDWPGGCSGVVVNRTNGDVTIKLVGLGLWRSSDQGTNWQRIDHQTVSGRDETGWATSVDANAPNRLASFSLDGAAGWTPDGVHWKRFADLGRNWDYGSVDWSSPNPSTILAAKHETTPPGETCASDDGGASWTTLAVRLNEDRGRISMVGALGPRILVYGNGDGIHRSDDLGKTWKKVSTANPQTRIPVYFNGGHYLGTTNGLLVSRDRGLNWQALGAGVNVWQGPFFGRDESQLLVVGRDGIHQSQDGGRTWRHTAGLKPKGPGFLFTPNWFGCYAWDPIHNVLYVSAMGNPVYQLKL